VKETDLCEARRELRCEWNWNVNSWEWVGSWNEEIDAVGQA
jgi:hypothetical protein